MVELKEIPLSLSKDLIFKKLFKVAEVSNLKPEDMNAYQRELKRKRDNYSHDQYIREKSAQLGLQEGLEKGLQQGLVETAKKMLADNLPIDLIIKYTGLSKEEIENL